MTTTRSTGTTWSDAAHLATATAHERASVVLAQRWPERAREHQDKAVRLRERMQPA